MSTAFGASSEEEGNYTQSLFMCEFINVDLHTFSSNHLWQLDLPQHALLWWGAVRSPACWLGGGACRVFVFSQFWAGEWDMHFLFFFFSRTSPMTSLLKTLASLSHGALVSLWWKKIISHLKNSLRNVLSFSFETRWEPSFCLQWLSTCVIEDEFLPYLTDSSCQQHC